MSKSNRKNNLILFLASLLIFMNVSAPFLGAFKTPATNKPISVQTPCSQQKASQGQALKLCHSYQHLQFASAISSPLFAFLSPTEKLNLLFIAVLLLMSPIYLIFKPPKSQFAL
jgi:hypothetical protein